MSKINTLSSEIIPKIAAGEVVQRPASVIKELVENSIDAEAKNILIEIEQSGLKKIKIVDDGEGMNADDLKKSFLSHTTSKINNLEDLALVKTFGFRGEALASICAVSDVHIKSIYREDSQGNEISLHGGLQQDLRISAISKGTVIEVTDLFAHFPARKKFLKSSLQENQFILNVLIGFCLSHLDVGFDFYRDGKNIFKISVRDNLLNRVSKLLGKDYAVSLVPVAFKDDYLTINGFISKPQNSAPNRNTQFLFVNKRLVDDLGISKTIKDAYKNLLDAHSYPPFILNINLDWGLVDVNVHPQKEKVHFWNDLTVKTAIYNAIVSALKNTDLTYDLNTKDTYLQDRKAVKHLYKKLKDSDQNWNIKGEPAESYDLAFQIAKTYIALPSREGLVLIDQHAAHESILYMQFLESFKGKITKRGYKLDQSVVVEIPLNMRMFLFENLKKLEELGFVVEKFGEDMIKILEIPEILKDHNISEVLLEVLSDLQEDLPVNKVDSKSNKTIAYLACRSAVKAGDVLNKDEIKRLLEKMDALSDVYTCPHGRPVKVRVSMQELGKMFKRIK